MSTEISPVRTEDSFDVGAVHNWLRNQIPLPNELPIVEQFRSGASNLTYLLRYSDLQLVLRRPPKGTKAISAHDMSREFSIQKALKPHFPYVPNVLALCRDSEIIGSDFYVMERINGLILRRDVPEDVSLTLEQTKLIGKSVVKGLVELHSIDAEILSGLNKGPGYVSRQVSGWSSRYRSALTDDVPPAEELMAWLFTNQPGDIAERIIHGDWRLDNIILNLEPTPKIVGVLDWELATVGDPLMDLGSALAYWIDRNDDPTFAALRRQPSNLSGMPTREEFVSQYLELLELHCSDFTFYEVFGLFRLAVIAQQIWARFKAGQTTNPSFSQFGAMVNILINRAMEKI